MNRFLILIAFFTLINLVLPNFSEAGFSPNITIKLFVEDSKGRRDTVTFGMKESSTIGMDEQFGESNLYGYPPGILDIRVIQRDSLHFNCIRKQEKNENLYFPENIDSKIDFRPFSEPFEGNKYVGFDSENNNFEIKILATDYPVLVTGDFSDPELSYLGWSGISKLNLNCEIIEMRKMFPYQNIDDTLFVLENSSYNTLVARFLHEVSVKDFNTVEPTWEIFPNPANQTVTINGLEALNSKIELIDLSGKVLNSLELKGNNSMIMNIGSIPKGTYFIRCLDETKEEMSVRKLIIE